MLSFVVSSRVLSPTIIAALFVLAGCAGGDSRNAGFRVETRDGISHSVAVDAPETDEALELVWEAPSTAEIAEGSSWADPTEIAAGVAGIAVADPQIPRIHLFDLDGSRTGSFGRRGEGPGELTGPRGLAFHGDTVIVQDGSRAALQLFRRSDGEYIGDLGSPEGMSFGFHYLSGAGVMRSLISALAQNASAQWMFLGIDGESHEVELPGDHPLQPDVQAGGSGCWRRGEAGPYLLEMDCTFPLVRVVDRHGDVVREHRIDREPVETAPETLDAVAAKRAEAMREDGIPQALIDQVLSMQAEQERDRWVPTMRGVRGSPSDHRILIWEQLPSEYEPDGAVFRILDDEGRYLLRHDFDVPLQAVTLSDDRVYVLIPDPDTGLKSLQAYVLP